LIGLAPNHADCGETHRVVLDGEAVEYRLVRTRRRTIGMEIGLSGLTVRAPRWASLRSIHHALNDRATWIRSALARWAGRRRDVLPRQWISGAPIVYRGEALVLDVCPARDHGIVADLFHFRVRHPAANDEREIARYVGTWFKDEALRVLAPEIARLAMAIGVAPPPLRISNARSLWGSCSRNGSIRLNWRLIQLPPRLARYVAAHEVAHLVELNHSSRFWSQVEALHARHADDRRALDEWTALLES
jgi:predicted metal-dependent hydrolase